MNSGRFISNLVLLVFLASQVMMAQVTTGTILGTVNDSTGAVIPGATVTLRNVETGITRTITTDAAGRFRAPQLGLGSYEITAEAAGFQTAVRTGITLTVGREALVDFTLQVGAVAERITVTGEAPLIETTNATLGNLVDERTLRELPLLGRSFADLTAIQPGVVGSLNVSGRAAFTGGGDSTRRSIGGSRPTQSTFLLDGIETTTPSGGMPVASAMGDQLGVDAIREFTVLQSNFGAQYGRAAAGVINAVTQSGTNEFHGTLFHFLRNEKMDARDYFLDPSLSKAPLKRNQYGGSAGGPLKKDRMFFFANYEGVTQRSGDPQIGSSLTPETRAGRFSNCPTGLTTCSREQAVTTNRPVNADVFPLINLLPLPNGAYKNAGVADYNYTMNRVAGENYGIGRIDLQMSDRDSLFGRITIDRSSVTDSWKLLTPGGYNEYQDGGYILAGVSYGRVLSPTLLNTFRVGFTRRNDKIYKSFTRFATDFPGLAGMDPRLELAPRTSLGNYSISGVSFRGCCGPGVGGPASYIDNTIDFEDSLALTLGPHSIVAGGTFKRYRMNTVEDVWAHGTFSWNTIERFLSNTPFQSTHIIGFNAPGSLYQDGYRGWRQAYGALYIQDDFRVRPNLTLNLGVRWEAVRSPREVNGKLSQLKDFYNDKTFTLLTKDDPYFSLDDGLKGFSPRVGFAWTPFGNQKTVFRSGFGAFREVPLLYIYQLAIEAPPYSIRTLVQQPALKYPYPFQGVNTLADLQKLGLSAGSPLLVAQNIKMPYTLQYTATLEQQIGTTYVVKATYVGTRGIGIWMSYNAFQPPTVIKDGRQYTEATAKPANPNFSSTRYTAPASNQHYNAMQLSLEKRFSYGLRLTANYTLSKNLDSGGGAGIKGAESAAGTGFNIANQYDLKGEKGLSPLHVKHNAVFSYTYELPFGSQRRWGSQWTGILDRILGGWVVSGTTNVRSGLAVNIGGRSARSRCLAECDQRPDLKPAGNNNPIIDNWIPEKYFDPSNFVLQPVGFFGNVGRNTLIRPGIYNWNFSLKKDNRFGERTNLEFRAEMFNLANHPNFGTPGTSIFRNDAGDLATDVARITTTSSDMRRIQLGLKLTF